MPAYQARLPKMGWQPAGEPGSFTRHPGDAPGAEAIFERFTRHIEAMARHLKVQLAVAERRGLADRAALIRQAMRS